MRTALTLLLALLVLPGTPVSGAGAAPAALPGGNQLWFGSEAQAPRLIRLYFFWSRRCPHCLEARPFVTSLPERYPWLQLVSHELSADPQSRERFVDMAALLGQQPASVPTFMLCGRMFVGWGGEQQGARFLEQQLLDCYADVYGEAAPQAPRHLAGLGAEAVAQLKLPGGLEAASLSLPVLTLVLAGMDAFNPCAFFVLLFLLGMLVHSRSRRFMLLVGGVFVTVSAVVYFAFMAAWLNLFLLFGEVQLVTLVAGGVAILIALINIKDYFWFRRGPSLTLGDGHRHSLFRRSRELLGQGRVSALLASTVLLALVANMYELLCTAGFPMIYTRILTLEQLSPAAYYVYLGLYNLVYVIPLLLIVALFAVSLGARKLSESQGRFLKLLSGLMMLGLGLLLVVAPQRLDSPVTAALLLGAALAAAIAIARLTRGSVASDTDTNRN